jgi:hypothetical protein
MRTKCILRQEEVVNFKGMATEETENIIELGQFVVLKIQKEN